MASAEEAKGEGRGVKRGHEEVETDPECAKTEEDEYLSQWKRMKADIESISEEEEKVALAGLPTPGTKCLGNCGFFGRLSGHCSMCFKKLSLSEKIAHYLREKKLQPARDAKLAEERKAAEEAAAQKKAAEEKAQAEAEAAKAEEKEAMEKRKAAGECYKITDLVGQNSCAWGIWGLENSDPGVTRWSCGLHHVCPGEEAVPHEPCESEDWKPLAAACEELDTLLADIVEVSDGDYPYEATFILRSELNAHGARASTQAHQLFRKALHISAPCEEVRRLSASVKDFWGEYYHNNDEGLQKKLQDATALLKRLCKRGSLRAFRFAENTVVYPRCIAGITKEGGHLVLVFAVRVDT